MEPKAEVPFSDSLLLSVSVAGFCVLAVTVYKIILAKTSKNGGGDETNDPDGDADLTPEEWLVRRANVATLNRAQRRARAKAMMKEQRRAAPVVQHQPVAGEGEQQQVVAEAEENDDNNHHPLLSRKERQAAAKALEREERLRYQSERQRQQEQALQAAQRLKQNRRAAEQQSKHEAAVAEQRRRDAERAAWETFLSSSTCAAKTQSVDEFVQQAHSSTAAANHDRAVRLAAVASDFDVTVDVVAERLEQLVREGRLAGFFDDNDNTDNNDNDNPSPTTFVVVAPEELEQMAAAIMKQGTVTLSEIATLCETVLRRNSDPQQQQPQSEEQN